MTPLHHRHIAAGTLAGRSTGPAHLVGYHYLMSVQPTYDDVNLILRLYEERRDPKLREARNWFVRNFFPRTLAEVGELCPPGSDPEVYVRMVTSYWEMVASFITKGVLNEQLFFESGGELLVVWTRIKHLATDMRSFMGNPSVWGNMEKVATDYIAHMNEAAPGAYEAFEKRINNRPGAQTAKG